jgi:hypothetical protein
MNIKNRIVAHVRMKAKELVPHELNPRTHTEEQREALLSLYDEIGFARSVLGFKLPPDENGVERIKLIDGHLRQSLDPEMEIDVEVLDVTEEEAKKLLLSIDPLAQLAEFDNTQLQALRDQVQTDSNTLAALWAGIAERDEAINKEVRRKTRKPKEDSPEQFVVMIECKSEQEQITLLRRFKKEGLTCKAMTS